MFQICDLALGNGTLGISPAPGRDGRYQADLTTVLQWSPTLVFTMVTMGELERLDATSFGEDLQAASVEWAHLPVPDFGAPPADTAALWSEASRAAHASLGKGGRVLAHCYGGCGRSGMALMRLMVEAGEDPNAALLRLRRARSCAVETDAQAQWAYQGRADG